MMKFTGTKKYVATRELEMAVNAAIALERPLDVATRDWKNHVSIEVADALKTSLFSGMLSRPQRHNKDYTNMMLYHDCVIPSLGMIESDIEHYKKRPLGGIFLRRAAVVLLDEIDKADIEFPNDLLRELDRMEFFVYETQKLVKAASSDENYNK